MILKDLGEFNLIERISRGVKLSRQVVKGIGDDAAVLRGPGDKYTLFTSDMLVEDRHFYRHAGGYLIGKKALSSNLSDIAAMGGVPGACVVSLGAPASLKVRFIDELYRGLRDVAAKYKVDLVGGDTVCSKKIIINVALLGKVEKNNLVLRSGASEGDAIFLTGDIGGSQKGKHLDFSPRLKEARFLVKNFKIRSMIDISDGLLADVGHILKESRCGAVLYEKNIPISRHAEGFNSAIKDGEDFELVFTLPAKGTKRLEEVWPFRIRLSRIGEVCSKKQGLFLVRKNGKKEKLIPEGYRHF